MFSLWKQHTALELQQKWCYGTVVSPVYCSCHRTVTDGNCSAYSLAHPTQRVPCRRGSAVVVLGHCLHLLVLGVNAVTPVVCNGKESGPMEWLKIRESTFLLENFFPTLTTCINTQRKTIHIWMHVLLLSIFKRKNSDIGNQGWQIRTVIG